MTATRTKISAVVMMIAACLFSLPALAGETLKFGYFPFYVYHATSDPGHMGPVRELADKLAEKVGVDLEFVEMPNKRFRSALAEGRIDISIVTNRYKEFQDDSVIWSSRPFFYVQMAAFTRDETLEIKRPADLKGKSVVVRRGFDYMGWRDYINDPANGVKIAGVVDKTEQGVRVLTMRQPDVLLEYVGNVEAARIGMGVQPLPYALLNRMPFYLIVSNAVPNADKVLEKFETAFDGLLKMGRIDQEGNLLYLYSKK